MVSNMQAIVGRWCAKQRDVCRAVKADVDGVLTKPVEMKQRMRP